MIIIDRFEGGIAVLETDSGMFEVPKELVSPDASEGDVLAEKNGEYTVDAAETEKRRAEISRKFNRLRRRKND